MIPYGKQNINQEDIDAVIEVLRSDFLTQGPKVPIFEDKLVKYTGSKYAFAVNSATSALHISCLALGLTKGDTLWTSPNTFVASANCALYCGANVDFVDIDPATFNLCTKKLEEKLKVAQENNCLPKVLVAVHLCGQSCDMKKIHELSNIYKFKVIEDASHAIGGKYNGDPVGNCAYSDITVFSFHPVKIITTAEGGAALTNDPELAKSLNILRTHGITRDEELMDSELHGPWYYEQIDLGFNYRMTELQAALGISQMNRIDEFILERHKLAKRYSKELKNLPISLPKDIKESFSSLHLFVIRLKLEKITLTHKEVFMLLREKGLGVNLHYIPVHIQPFYKHMGFKEGDFPESEKYYSEAISIPIFHGMSASQQDKVINILKKVLLECLKE